MDQNLFNEICLQQLTLSGVHEGETVAVLTRGAERGEYADAFLWAAQQAGGGDVPPAAALAGVARRAPGPSATPAWARTPSPSRRSRRADMLVDCTFLLFSKEQFAIQDAGTRILTAVEPAPLLARLMPTTELRERVEVGAELLAKAQTMRITSPHGTDVTYRLGRLPDDERVRLHRPARPLGPLARRVRVHRRRRRRRRREDRALARRRAAAVQHLRADPGDDDHRAGLHPRHPWRARCRPAQLVHHRASTTPAATGCSHVGWGLDERAHWHGLTQFGGGMGMELRSFYGNVMFSIGPNNELGGPNDTPCHFDIPMRGNSLYLDDELIVDAGELTVPEMRPARRR